MGDKKKKGGEAESGFLKERRREALLLRYSANQGRKKGREGEGMTRFSVFNPEPARAKYYYLREEDKSPYPVVSEKRGPHHVYFYAHTH